MNLRTNIDLAADGRVLAVEFVNAAIGPTHVGMSERDEGGHLIHEASVHFPTRTGPRGLERYTKADRRG